MFRKKCIADPLPPSSFPLFDLLRSSSLPSVIIKLSRLTRAVRSGSHIANKSTGSLSFFLNRFAFNLSLIINNFVVEDQLTVRMLYIFICWIVTCEPLLSDKKGT